jgi:hypothetical protein
MVLRRFYITENEHGNSPALINPTPRRSYTFELLMLVQG